MASFRFEFVARRDTENVHTSAVSIPFSYSDDDVRVAVGRQGANIVITATGNKGHVYNWDTRVTGWGFDYSGA